MIRVPLPILQNKFELIPQLEKLDEEVGEVREVIDHIHDGNMIASEKVHYKELTSEVLDVMQVCVGMLDNIERKYPGLVSKAGKDHLMKLKEKNYRIKSVLILEND